MNLDRKECPTCKTDMKWIRLAIPSSIDMELITCVCKKCQPEVWNSSFNRGEVKE